MTTERAGRSTAVEELLVETLFNQTATLVVGGVALVLVALIGYLRTGQPWFLAWSAAALIVLLARLTLQCAFERRRKIPGRHAVWRTRFIIGACAMGALLGCAGVPMFTGVDPITQLFISTVQTVIIMGAATRNAACEAGARAQVVLGVVPGFVGCLWSPEPFYHWLCVFIVFEICAAFALLRHINAQTVRLLCANEENLVLMAEVVRANAELGAANARLEGLANDLEAANQRLEFVAMSDALTGIANRRWFDRVLASEVSRAQRDPVALSLLLLDIDSFKSFNDLYGHVAGDECLRRVAQAFAATPLRPSDLVARYGGEEFVAILPQADARDAAAVAEVARAAIEGLGIVNAAAPDGIVTVSIGVASFSVDQHLQAEDLVRSADEALYAAKAAGRNCVRLACAAWPTGQLIGTREGTLL